MREVTDAFLLNVAEVSATLFGLFLVGVFFYLETGPRQRPAARKVFEPYLRASTRILLVLFALPLGLSLTLVALDPVWARVLFALLSLMLLVTNIETAVRIRAVTKATGSTALAVNEIASTLGVLTLIALPWALGGLHPTREHLAAAILLSLATAFFSICTVVLSAFDLAHHTD